MDSSYYNIVEDDLGLVSTIETELLKALRSENRQALNSKFLLSSRDQQGELVGGLSASTAYGWMLIELVWVCEEARGAGIGSALIQAAEKKGTSLNCHAAWLETSSATARRLYSKLGYVAFGELRNNPGQFPDEHHRWFMKKSL